MSSPPFMKAKAGKVVKETLPYAVDGLANVIRPLVKEEPPEPQFVLVPQPPVPVVQYERLNPKLEESYGSEWRPKVI